MATPPPATLSDPLTNTHVTLTHSPLDLNQTINHVRSPKAGAIVLFAGKPLSPSPPLL